MILTMGDKNLYSKLMVDVVIAPTLDQVSNEIVIAPTPFTWIIKTKMTIKFLHQG